MNAQEIIEYIRTSEKKTPVQVYVWEKDPVSFPNCREFPAGNGCKIVFGDWKDVKPVLAAHEFDHVEVENGCRNSAIPLLDLKNIPARIEPGAYIREQVELAKAAVSMMGAGRTGGAGRGGGRRDRPRAAVALRPGPPCRRGRGAQGRPQCGRHPDHGIGVLPVRRSGTRRCGNDRRDHPARQ